MQLVPFEVKVHMGPVEPPQHKGHLPQYAGGKFVELQQTFDEIKNHCVFRCPKDISVSVEHFNPSFVVKKASGSS